MKNRCNRLKSEFRAKNYRNTAFCGNLQKNVDRPAEMAPVAEFHRLTKPGVTGEAFSP
ncbi:MAG: hypothetical protein ABSG67_01115 [Thermoguttaceae bacterium]|jgi:hypothetical protein